MGAAVRQGPNQRQGRVDDRNWEQVDLLPTVADLLKVRVPWRMDGRSQAGPPARRRTEKWWFDIPGHREVRDGPSNFAVALRGVTETLVRAEEGARGLYRYGPFADLVDQPPRAVGPVGGSPASADMDDWARYQRIEPSSGEVPALVSGELTSGPPPPGTTVLVAVNGRIAGESRLFAQRPGDPAAHFAVIAPDRLFKAGLGRAQPQVFLVHRAGGRTRLQPVALSG